jgi:hypothetical protein
MQQESTLTYLSLKDDDYLQEPSRPKRPLGFVPEGEEDIENGLETRLIEDSNVLRQAANRVKVGVNPMMV